MKQKVFRVKCPFVFMIIIDLSSPEFGKTQDNEWIQVVCCLLTK